jgi:ribosomal protein L40E
MFDRAGRNGKALALLIVWTVALGGLFTGLLALSTSSRAGPCDQVGGVITGDWSITNAQVCSGIVYTVDGSININAGGSLTLINGGLRFAKDGSHQGYSLNVNAGGALILDNSTVTTETNAIQPYLKLGLTVSGAGSQLVMRNGASLKFPGWFNATGATLNITDSTITGFEDAELAGLGLDTDDNNDAPLMVWNSTVASAYGARIERIYEYSGGDGAALSLVSGSALYAYDTYIAVDYSDVAGWHNELAVDGTSNAHLYNVIIDRNQDPGALVDWQPAFIATAPGGNIYLYRWVHAFALDPNCSPASGATIWSRLSPSSTTAQYPDNGFGSTPSSRTLAYIGRSGSGPNAFNATNSAGMATIPLYTDRVDNATLPNAESFGNYEETGTYVSGTTYTTSEGAVFPAYPRISEEDNNIDVTLFFSVSGVCPEPELSVTDMELSGGNLGSQLQPINTDINVTATIHNAGDIAATNVKVSFFEDNVDRNDDGLMDFAPIDFIAAGVWIGDGTAALVPVDGDVDVTVVWHPTGALESSRTVSAVVDPPVSVPADGGNVSEADEEDNILARTFTLFVWPDLAISPADIQFASDPVVNNDATLLVRVRNVGTTIATGASLEVYEGVTRVAGPSTFNLAQGETLVVSIVWRPAALGDHVLTFVVAAPGTDIRNTDYILGNNQAVFSVTVLTQPDLELRQADYGGTPTVTQGQPFGVNVLVYNNGQTIASNVTIAAYLNGNRAIEVGRVTGLTIGTFVNQSMNVAGIALAGAQTLLLVVDPDNRINEGGAVEESNNFANISLNVQPPTGSVLIVSPVAEQQIEPGTTLSVMGYVRDLGGNGILGVALTIEFRSASGLIASNTSVSQDTGQFFATLTVPGDLADGSYTLTVSPATGIISEQSETIVIRRSVPFLNQPVPIIGLPYWLLFIIIAAAAAVGIGVTLYWKVYGLGKMVECGECGAFIPEDATTCPKCGVEFEKDMAKCSNCQAWIPVDVKQCPECGVEFATGEVEMADYQEKMRLQYDEVVEKFKEEASRQLGRALSDREFQEWWRKQPTFLTFEDWLREEEEMRKMGSKPCPVCGTLNSVTATVCHKCGSLMREAGRPPSGGGGAPPSQPARRATSPEPAPQELQGTGSPASPYGPPTETPTGTEAIPRRVIRRPVGATQPVVQKKVIKRPLGEGEGQSTEGQGSGENPPEDEL